MMALQQLRALAGTARRLGGRDGTRYLTRQLQRALRLYRDDMRRLPAAPRQVLFVCHGNIVRSPMAAAGLEAALAARGRTDIVVTSAGLHGDPDRPADERAALVAREFGLCLDHHRTRRLSHEMVEGADVVFVMDCLNEAKVLGRHPRAAAKLFMLGTVDRAASDHTLEIADPYRGSTDDIRRCSARLVQLTQELAARFGTPDRGKRTAHAAPLTTEALG